MTQSPKLEGWSLFCVRCGERFAPGPLFYGCPSCSEPDRVALLEMAFEPAEAPPPLSARMHRRGLARYADLLPFDGAADPLLLGEGDTALVPSRHIGPRLGLKRLYFKNEAANPTASFKDRYVAVSLNVARALGFDRIAVSSTGNLGIAAAAYAAAAGMRCLFLAPDDAPPAVLAHAQLHGADTLVTSHDGRQVLFEHAVRRHRCFPVGLFLPRPVNNPFGIEGYKTFAYEVLDQLGQTPGAMLFPCARGNGLYGAWKGFREAIQWGWTSAMPALWSCQPVGANSLEVSLARGAVEAVELPPVKTIAFSTAETVASSHTLLALRDSGGGGVSASDPEIVAAVAELAREGLLVEPSAALSVACLPRLIEAQRIDPAAPVIAVLTAGGARWPIPVATPAAARIAPDPAALESALHAAHWR